MSQKNLISPYIVATVIIWLVWILFNFTKGLYYADSPGQVVYLWMKIRCIQGFNGMMATILLFSVYRRTLRYDVSNVSNAMWVVFLTYIFSLGLVLINMTVYRYFFDKTPLFLPWQQYLVVAFSKFFIFLGLSILFFLIVHWQELQQQKEKTLKAEALANEAHLQMLRYQLNPHFLFNALNSIRTLVYIAPEKADRVITQLSDFLRSTLSNEHDHVVTLSHEVNLIKHYLEIQKIRFEDRLIIDFDIDPGALDFEVPCFMIHPLVENAIKYGLETSPPPLQVEITATVKGRTLEACIRNTGKLNGKSETEGCGTGLKNVCKRLDHFYPGSNEFSLFEDDGYVCATIQITAKGTKR